MTAATTAIAAALAAVLALAGCASSNGSGTDAGGASSTTVTAAGGSAANGSVPVGAGQAGNAPDGRPTSTTATGATASTVGGASATTAAPATTAAGPKTSRDPLNPITIPDESSCAPGPGALPDGLYFGFLGGASEDAFEFDLACWFSGDPATAAAKADGEESPPPNDYYIRNSNETLRRVVAASNATVAWLPDLGNPATTDTTYGRWVTARDFGQAYVPPVWITVRNGAAVDIVEQWLP